MMDNYKFFYKYCAILICVVIICGFSGCKVIYGIGLIRESGDVNELKSLTVINKSGTPLEVNIQIPSKFVGLSTVPSEEGYQGYLASGEKWTWKKDNGPLYKVGNTNPTNGLLVKYRSVFSEGDNFSEVLFEREDHIIVSFVKSETGIDITAESRDGHILKIFDPNQDMYSSNH